MIILQKRVEKKDYYKKISLKNFACKSISNFSLFELSEWYKFQSQIKKKKIKVALEINSSEYLDLQNLDTSNFNMIQINFESFKDGRPFTIARKLRKENRFKGEIRAAGNILPDQFIFIIRSGFDTVKIPREEKDIWLELLDIDTGLYYQP